MSETNKNELINISNKQSKSSNNGANISIIPITTSQDSSFQRKKELLDQYVIRPNFNSNEVNDAKTQTKKYTSCKKFKPPTPRPDFSHLTFNKTLSKVSFNPNNQQIVSSKDLEELSKLSYSPKKQLKSVKGRQKTPFSKPKDVDDDNGSEYSYNFIPDSSKKKYNMESTKKLNFGIDHLKDNENNGNKASFYCESLSDDEEKKKKNSTSMKLDSILRLVNNQENDNKTSKLSKESNKSQMKPDSNNNNILNSSNLNSQINQSNKSNKSSNKNEEDNFFDNRKLSLISRDTHIHNSLDEDNSNNNIKLNEDFNVPSECKIKTQKLISKPSLSTIKPLKSAFKSKSSTNDKTHKTQFDLSSIANHNDVNLLNSIINANADESNANNTCQTSLNPNLVKEKVVIDTYLSEEEIDRITKENTLMNMN